MMTKRIGDLVKGDKIVVALPGSALDMTARVRALLNSNSRRIGPDGGEGSSVIVVFQVLSGSHQGRFFDETIHPNRKVKMA